MITPNKIEIEGEEITDEDIALNIKETKLNLQRARLKVGLPMEPISKTEKPLSEPYKIDEKIEGEIDVKKIPF